MCPIHKQSNPFALWWSMQSSSACWICSLKWLTIGMTWSPAWLEPWLNLLKLWIIHDLSQIECLCLVWSVSCVVVCHMTASWQGVFTSFDQWQFEWLCIGYSPSCVSVQQLCLETEHSVWVNMSHSGTSQHLSSGITRLSHYLSDSSCLSECLKCVCIV